MNALCMAVAGLRVWYISAEDDLDEIHRRIAAHLQRHEIESSQLGNRFFVNDATTFAFKIARSERSGVVFDDATLVAFEQAIAFDQIDVVTLDPFISFHQLPENDTSAMDALVKRLKDIATRQKCCIELSHHVRKPPNTGQFEVTVYDARGAGAIINAVRSCRVLNQMPKDVAEQNGISDRDRTRFIRIDSGKANMAPPEAAKWMELQSVEIANGDHVQALVSYALSVQVITSEDDKVWLRTIMAAGVYRASSQSDQWLGVAMAERFDRDIELKSDQTWLNKAIKEWESIHWIKKGKRICSDYKGRECWVLGDALRNEPQSPAAEQRAAFNAQANQPRFEVLGPELDGVCEQCGGNDDVYLIRNPFSEVRSHILHQECAAFFFRRPEQ